MTTRIKLLTGKYAGLEVPALLIGRGTDRLYYRFVVKK